MIKVVDKYGNTYSKTYEKRAEGLVKKKRAYWVDENKTTICLINPHNIKNENEEKKMKLTYTDIKKLLGILEGDFELLYSKNEFATYAAREIAARYNKIVKMCEDNEINLLVVDEIKDYDEMEDVRLVGILLVKIKSLIQMLKSELSECADESMSKDNTQSEREVKIILNNKKQNMADASCGRENKRYEEYKYELLNCKKEIDECTSPEHKEELIDEYNDLLDEIEDVIDEIEDAIDEIDDAIDEIDDAIDEIEDAIDELSNTKKIMGEDTYNSLLNTYKTNIAKQNEAKKELLTRKSNHKQMKMEFKRLKNEHML